MDNDCNDIEIPTALYNSVFSKEYICGSNIYFPVFLGQTIWVDSTTLPTDELAPDVLVRPYFKAEVRGLKIHMKGDTARKLIQFRVKARWRVGRNQYATMYKNFSYAVSGIGKTIFTEEPQ